MITMEDRIMVLNHVLHFGLKGNAARKEYLQKLKEIAMKKIYIEKIRFDTNALHRCNSYDNLFN